METEKGRGDGLSDGQGLALDGGACETQSCCEDGKDGDGDNVEDVSGHCTGGEEDKGEGEDEEDSGG